MVLPEQQKGSTSNRSPDQGEQQLGMETLGRPDGDKDVGKTSPPTSTWLLFIISKEEMLQA